MRYHSKFRKTGHIPNHPFDHFPPFQAIKKVSEKYGRLQWFQLWRRREPQHFHDFLPYISLVVNSGGMQSAGARAILEKSSEKTYREKTVRYNKRLIKQIQMEKNRGNHAISGYFDFLSPHRKYSFPPVLKYLWGLNTLCDLLERLTFSCWVH